MMKPTTEFCEAVRKRMTELSGSDPGELNIRDVFPGTDPNVTESEKIEAVAQSLIQLSDSDND